MYKQTNKSENAKINFLGFNVDNLSMHETIDKIKEIIKSRKSSQHVVVNAEKIVQAYKDPQLREVINSCEIINADGQAIIWASKLLGKPLQERVAGVDLMHELIKVAPNNGWRIFCLGATDDVNKNLINNFKSKIPSLQIFGHHGYFSEINENKIVEYIKSLNIDILFLGISSPKKEYFINKYLHDLEIPFCMGVGGSFDIFAGKTQRAPLWIQKAGFEWLYRAYQEPKRIGLRKLKRNPIFIYLVIKKYIKAKFTNWFGKKKLLSNNL